MSGHLSKHEWDEIARISRERIDRACREFQAGDLIDATDTPLLATIYLLLSNPHECGVEVIVWDDDIAAEPFITSVPCDSLGKYGKLIWRA